MLRLTDFVTLQRAKQLLAEKKQMVKRPKKSYDDKFRILSPSTSVGPELAYWREQCDLREVGLAFAYMDIDNFKTEFNLKYNETIIDLVCLPVIMRHIEGHVFKHGFAFREGGDEFIILLPNVDEENAIEFLDRLRNNVQKLTFHGVDSIATLSIGLCHVEADSQLIDGEIRDKANEAKKHAKTKGGKNCIVSYQDNEFQVVRPKAQ